MTLIDLSLVIDASAITSEDTELFMPIGSLTSLCKLKAAGIRLYSQPEVLSAEIRKLLTQESLSMEEQPFNDGSIPETVFHIAAAQGQALRLSGKSLTEPLLFDSWQSLASHFLSIQRTATCTRETAETAIKITVNLDGSGKATIQTGLPFYDHMLEQIARHGYIDLDIRCDGDLHIDEHHTIEDTAIALGETIAKALGDKRGIGRYGFMVAMDETRSLAAIDLSGRPWCVFEGTFSRDKVGDFPTEMASHFFHSLAMALRATLHVAVKGDNDHHQIEACFKSLGRALRQAVDRNEKYIDILPSSKGLL